MARKTNKTSHVLNLITNGAPEAEETQSAQEAAPKDVAEPQKAAPENKVIVVNETSENEKLSNEIKNRLEAQLEAEVAEAEAQASREASVQPRPEASNVVVKEPEAQPQQVAAVPTAPQAPVQEQPAAEAPEAPEVQAQPVMAEASAVQPQPAMAAASAVQPQPMMASSAANMQPVSREEIGLKKVMREPAYRMLNVMERLLGNIDLEGQMKQYGVCLCSRCRADVQALVLTNLPSKYVIVDGSATSPIIGYYEGNYRTQIFTEIAKACVKVKDRPRH